MGRDLSIFFHSAWFSFSFNFFYLFLIEIVFIFLSRWNHWYPNSIIKDLTNPTRLDEGPKGGRGLPVIIRSMTITLYLINKEFNFYTVSV